MSKDVNIMMPEFVDCIIKMFYEREGKIICQFYCLFRKNILSRSGTIMAF